MLSQLRAALVLFVLLSVITGVVYPLVITGVAQVVFHEKANGSIIRSAAGEGGGVALGSSLIGQEFGTSDAGSGARQSQWFWGRPSATSPVAYGALNRDAGTGSSGSNLATTNPALLENIKARLSALDAADASVGIVRVAPGSGSRVTAVPVDLVTSSGSGLDPHISPSAAEYQVARVAKARKMSEESVLGLVKAHTKGRALGVLGEPVVNVLELNRALVGMEHR